MSELSQLLPARFISLSDFVFWRRQGEKIPSKHFVLSEKFYCVKHFHC